jgi:hypothetical protein
MAQRQGLFGLEIGTGDTIKKALTKAGIPKYYEPRQFGLFTVRNGLIVRIARNGKLI